MENIKQINIKNRTYYFFSDMINISFLFKLTKNKQKIVKKYWYLQHWIPYN